MKEKVEKMNEFLYEVNYEQIKRELEEKYGEVRKSLKWLDISDEVGKFYDCDAESRRINGKSISAPVGYRSLNRKVKKVGFSDYPELLGYDREERNERILEYVKLWVVYVGIDKLRELEEKVEGIDLRLPDEKDFVGLVETQKKKMGDVNELAEGIDEIREKLRGRDRSGYEEMSEREKEKIDERARELVEEWSG
ncbi:MAG: hypothetical protein ACOC87_03275 [Candidatus Natronoplasma sp.]